MLKWLKRHLRDNKGDANVSKTTVIAIVFVVGAILLVLTTSAFRNPINRWFDKVQSGWFGGDNGYYALNDPYIMYGKNTNGTIKDLAYRFTYLDGSYVEIPADEIASWHPEKEDMWYYTGGYYGGTDEDVTKNWWGTGGWVYCSWELSADGSTLTMMDGPWEGSAFVAHVPEQ